MKKRILITGGASWVALDDIRILTNIFTGSTSVFLAKVLSSKYDITLLVNPVRADGIEFLQGVRVIPYMWYDEFVKKVTAVLKQERFDFIVHSAALSDFAPVKKNMGKMSSRHEQHIVLKPVKKALPLMRKLSSAVIVQFKLESGKNRQSLVDQAYASLRKNKTDFVIANDYQDIKKGNYARYLIDTRKQCVPIPSQEALPDILEDKVFLRFGRAR